MPQLKHEPVVSTFRFAKVHVSSQMFGDNYSHSMKGAGFDHLFISLFGCVWCIHVYQSFTSVFKSLYKCNIFFMVITLTSIFPFVLPYAVS